jgi:hypothetical protein
VDSNTLVPDLSPGILFGETQEERDYSKLIVLVISLDIKKITEILKV